ncbi:glutamate synthase (NADPH) small subunit [Geothermobacter ehrlichii]|uniref:Glutamate synthase (NADPH) small subunit n=1 Tax=Geothermobacter ehrlichii TaxID=213224 RepID=A0A5D3WMR1_9BACT|nr:glutamate synthase subunit beta [Geothermobacter ehrlichii]TYO99887.1 glutamate synthase (NADPH) small subunit [Geothermobacter ehrlichii]
MQGFIDTTREEPEKQDVNLRIRSFEEIYRFFSNRTVARQAERCVQCGDPFCTTLGCPLNNHIPQWLEAIAEKDLEKAFLLSNETSPFPEILGRICPHNRLCEGACTLDDGYGAISIGAIEASITDLGFAAGYTLPFPGISTGKRVAVVGSGPAGMSCAHFLLRAGIAVEMFERSDQPGGLLTYGIPGFKLDKELIRRRFDILTQAGLKLHLNTAIGSDKPLQKLLDSFDAVFLGLGCTSGKRAGIPGEDHPQVFLAMEFLTNVQRRLAGLSWMERFGVLGKRVVVVGGGDTAMDCVRTAVREGAESVVCLYRRDAANMPGSSKEFHNAAEEGVQFMFTEAPKRIVIGEDGELVGIDAIRTRLGEPDTDGRRRVEEIPGSEHCVAADVVIMALGFDHEPQPFLRDFAIELERWGNIRTDENGATSHPKIFAGGDCQRGADLAVTAALDGRRAALGIIERLLGPATP